MITMTTNSFKINEKMLHLREKLLSVEEDRLAGRVGCDLEELEEYLDVVLSLV